MVVPPVHRFLYCQFSDLPYFFAASFKYTKAKMIAAQAATRFLERLFGRHLHLDRIEVSLALARGTLHDVHATAGLTPVRRGGRNFDAAIELVVEPR